MTCVSTSTSRRTVSPSSTAALAAGTAACAVPSRDGTPLPLGPMAMSSWAKTRGSAIAGADTAVDAASEQKESDGVQPEEEEEEEPAGDGPIPEAVDPEVWASLPVVKIELVTERGLPLHTYLPELGEEGMETEEAEEGDEEEEGEAKDLLDGAPKPPDFSAKTVAAFIESAEAAAAVERDKVSSEC